MKNIQLPLTKQWFDMTQAGIKTEDYREITPYFCCRFLLFKGEHKGKEWWRQNFFECRSMQKTIISIKGNSTFKPFAQNIMTLGYPKREDYKKILTYEHKGIEINQGNPEWGAVAGVHYFVVKHGKSL